MGVVLGNSTENIINIDNTGGITISSIISGASKNLTKAGSGSGTLTLSGVNTYSGNTTITAGTLALSISGSIANSPIITIGSGGTFDVTGLTTALALGSTQTLKSSATGSNTTATVTVSSTKGLTLGSTGGLAFTAYGGGATAPITVTGATAGALALNSAPITVTTTTALAAGTYTLIAKGGSATGVSGTPGTLTVNGSGLAANTSGSLSVSSGQLILTVVSVTTPSFSISGTTSHGSMCLNTAATKQTYTITNSGTAATNVVVSSSDTQFAVSNLSSTSISGSGGTATYDVTFTPTSTGAKTSTITVYYDTNTSAATSSLTGTGVNTAPTVTASAATGVGLYTSTLPGTITVTGCTAITAYGIEYSTSNGFVDGAGTQVTGSNLSGSNYSVALSGLNLGTTYYYKTFATNSGGTSYSTQSSFITSTPTITVNTITTFGNQTVNTISTEKSFIVSGSNLIADVSIAPPSGFEISTGTGGSFAATNPIVLSPSGGTLASTTIYVRFAPTLLQAYSGNIDITSTSATTKTVAVIGTGTAAADPTGVSATAASSVQIDVAFTKNANNNNVIIAWNSTNSFGTPTNGTTYNVSDVLSGGGTILYKGATSPYNHSSLSPNSTYYYKIWSYDGVNYYSAGVTTNATTNSLSTVNATSGTDLSSTGFTAHWDAVVGAESYKLDVSTASNFGYSSKLSENFGLFTTNNGSADRSASLDTYMQTAGWTGTAVYEMIGYTKIGAGSTKGILTTPTVDLSGNSGNATLTFDLMKYGSDATLIQVFHATDGSTFNQVGTDITAPVSLTTQTISITGGTVNSKIRIAAKIANNYRYYIDNFNLTQENPTALLGGYNNLSVSGTSQSVTALSPNSTYYYRVRATSTNSTSANSNTTTVLTAPSAPTAAEETNNTATGFTATWALPTGGATSYALDVSENIGFSSFVSGYENLAVTGTSHVVSGLSPNTTYYYRVKAINATATATSGTITAATNNSIAVTGTVNVSTLPVCSTCDVVVAAGATLTVNENRTFNAMTVNPTGKLTNTASTLTLATLNLNSDATGTGTFVDNGTSIITAAHVQQYLTTGRNWYVSIPVTAADTTALSTSNAVKYWDEPTGLWKSPTVLALDVRKGYIAAGTKSTGVITFDGELNNGNVTFNATRTEGVYKEGFNLIGNPYPSYVNWESATKTRVGTSIWYRTKNSGGTYVFDTFNGVGTNNNQGGAVTGMIPPMQAVWVRVDVAQTTGSVLFTNAMRAHESGTNKLKAPAVNNPLQILRLQVSNVENSDEAIIVFNDNASNALDTYDSPKMTNSNNAIPEIYSLIGSDELVINGMNSYSSTTEIPVGFRTGATNNFSIKATEVSNFEDGTQIILKDSELTTETDITNGTPYTFASDAVSTPNRFSIIFRNSSITTGLDHNQSNDKSISVYRNSNSHIVVNCSSDIVGNGNVSVYNAIGQKLTYKAINSTSTVLEQSYTAGVYFVSVVANGKTITRKVIVD